MKERIAEGCGRCKSVRGQQHFQLGPRHWPGGQHRGCGGGHPTLQWLSPLVLESPLCNLPIPCNLEWFCCWSALNSENDGGSVKDPKLLCYLENSSQFPVFKCSQESGLPSQRIDHWIEKWRPGPEKASVDPLTKSAQWWHPTFLNKKSVRSVGAPNFGREPPHFDIVNASHCRSQETPQTWVVLEEYHHVKMGRLVMVLKSE